MICDTDMTGDMCVTLTVQRLCILCHAGITGAMNGVSHRHYRGYVRFVTLTLQGLRMKCDTDNTETLFEVCDTDSTRALYEVCDTDSNGAIYEV